MTAWDLGAKGRVCAQTQLIYDTNVGGGESGAAALTQVLFKASPLELRGFQAPPFPVHPGYAAAQAINYKRKPPHLLKPSLREEKNTAFSLSLKNFIAVKPAPGSLVKQKRASDGLGDSWGGSGGDTGCPGSSSTNPPPCCTDWGGKIQKLVLSPHPALREAKKHVALSRDLEGALVVCHSDSSAAALWRFKGV